MGIGDVIVIGLLLLWLAAALRFLVKAKRGGSCAGCSHTGCSRCSCCSNCDIYVGKKD